MGDALKGKVAIVTGSGQGIGRAIAVGMGLEGAKVVTNNRKRGSTGNAFLSDDMLEALGQSKKEWFLKETGQISGDAETTAAVIREAGGEAIPFFGDISDFKVAAKLIDLAVETYGGVDILVNVAGTFGFDNVWEISEELWDRVTRTKPKGYFNTMRHAIPHMLEKKWGRILNCTSRAFNGDVIKHAEYCTANAGVVGLTKAAAKELYRFGITCNAFAPFAKTRASYGLDTYDLILKQDQSVWVDKKFSKPLDTTPGPERIVPFLVYLCTDAAAKVSASVFNLGGNTIDLYAEPVIEKSLIKHGDAWTLEELMEEAPKSILAGYKSPADMK
ncbi:MAG: SDR family NAD(P)-dependent oxidoreductase [Syntrophorhabdales bacterium]